MTTMINCCPESVQPTCEAGGWFAFRLLQPELKPDVTRLLVESAEPRPGNQRFATEGGQAYMLCEIPDADGLLSWQEARERLVAPAHAPMDDVTDINVACALGETGYPWSQSPDVNNQWQAIANGRNGRRELFASVRGAGAEISTRLAEWETDLAKTPHSAIARFLAAAHARIRFARFALESHIASVSSFASADRLDVELPCSVEAVVAACQLVRREVRALTDETVARAYLRATD